MYYTIEAGKNACHFADYIFNYTSLNKNVHILF